MNKIINKIKYKIKRSLFDLVFNVEGKKMAKSIIDSLIKEWQKLAVRFNPQGAWKIRPYVSDYLIKCLTGGQPVDILIQWCVTKMLDERKKLQGDKIEIQPNESKFFNEDLPRIISGLKKRGLKVNIYVTFNLSNFESGRPTKETEVEYKNLIKENFSYPEIVFFDDDEFWQNKFKSAPLDKVMSVLNNKALDYVVAQLKRFFGQFESNLSEEEFKKLGLEKICIEAGEGLTLAKEIFPNGFLIVPIEDVERYDFFKLLVPDFKDKLVPIVRRYPWRYKELY